MEVECHLGKCEKGEMRPHAVQMALATDHMGTRKECEAGIASGDVIAVRNAAIEALRGLGQQRGGRGCSSPWAKEKATPWDGKRAQTASRIFDVALSWKVNVMYWNEGCTTEGGASRGYWGLIGVPSSRTSPMWEILVLAWSCHGGWSA